MTVWRDPVWVSQNTARTMKQFWKSVKCFLMCLAKLLSPFLLNGSLLFQTWLAKYDYNLTFPPCPFQTKQNERWVLQELLMQVLKIWEDSGIFPFPIHVIAFIYIYFYLLLYIYICYWNLLFSFLNEHKRFIVMMPHNSLACNLCKIKKTLSLNTCF